VTTCNIINVAGFIKKFRRSTFRYCSVFDTAARFLSETTWEGIFFADFFFQKNECYALGSRKRMLGVGRGLGGRAFLSSLSGRGRASLVWAARSPGRAGPAAADCCAESIALTCFIKIKKIFKFFNLYAAARLPALVYLFLRIFHS
jgi:hypothetical protein